MEEKEKWAEETEEDPKNGRQDMVYGEIRALRYKSRIRSSIIKDKKESLMTNYMDRWTEKLSDEEDIGENSLIGNLLEQGEKKSDVIQL